MVINRDKGDGIILSDEQVEIIRSINVDNNDVCIMASSGSGKTSVLLFTLFDVTNSNSTGLFVAYNNKIASEIREKAPSWIETKTYHALAYKYIVARYGLKVKSRTDFKDFNNLGYREKSSAMKCLNEYCRSDIIKVSDLDYSDSVTGSTKDLVVRSMHGEIPITFDIYLKLFQIELVHKDIEPEKVDVIMADEFQDANKCMYSIFLNYPAKQRIAVGDDNQRINKFMGSSNSLTKFSMLDNVDVKYLSSTMRLSPEMADATRQFCRYNLDRNFEYIGKNTNKPSFNELMYMTRTNSELIEVITYLQSIDVKFSTTRKVDAIFHVFLMIKYNAKKEYNFYKEHGHNSPKFPKDDVRFIEAYSQYIKDDVVRTSVNEKQTKRIDAIDKLSMSLQSNYDSWFDSKYVSFEYWLSLQDLMFQHDDMIRTGKTIMSLSNNNISIYNAYKYAKELEKEKVKHSLTITTAHAAKG